MKTVPKSNDSQATFNALLASSIHDIKNSLSVVINSLDIFLDEPDKPIDTRQMSLIQFEARRINEDLIQLLTLYKSENNLLTTHIDEQDVEEFLDDIITQEGNTAKARGITLTLDCEDGLSGYFDSDLIADVLRNAIHNAIRHTKDSIQITARQGDGKSLEIQVLDNGSGINQSLATDDSSISHSTDTDNHGTGLGLHFCDIVTRLHNNRDKQGRISLENRSDTNGAVFTLYIP